jgi:hypothetical protein
VYLSVLAEKKSGSTQWKPGQSGNPNGRPPKEKETEYLRAMREHFTPEQIVEVIRSLLADDKSWRARHAGAELLLHYALGKPTQRIAHSTASTPDEWLAALRGDAEGDDKD